jgi:hypothetical protein
VKQLKADPLEGKHLALPSNIRPDRKGLLGIDGISHLVSLLVTMKGSFIRLTPGNFFPSSLTTRTNKLEGLSLETLSSRVLKLRARSEPTQLEHLSDTFFSGKLLVLPANVRLDWKAMASYKHSSLLQKSVNYSQNEFYDTGPKSNMCEEGLNLPE